MNNNLKYRKNINNDHNLHNLKICKSMIKDNMDEFEKLGEGHQGMVYKIRSSDCGSIVLKKYKSNFDKNKYGNLNTLEKKRIFMETWFLHKITDLINNNICPNFIYLYYSKININDDAKHVHNNTYILMEYADANLITFFNTNYKYELYNSLFFQIFVAVLCIQKYLKGIHGDLSISNIFYKKINDNIVFKYIINDKTYYVPTYGYLFMIADFERSESLLNNIHNNNNIDTYIDTNHDLHMIKSLYRRPIKKYMRDNNIDTTSKLLNMLNTNDKNKLSDIISNIKKKAKKLNITNSEKYVFSELLHYILTEKIIDYTQIVDDNTNKLVDYLYNMKKKIFIDDKPIENILYDYFYDKYSNKINGVIYTFNITF
jgi:hypothetical protein